MQLNFFMKNLGENKYRAWSHINLTKQMELAAISMRKITIWVFIEAM
jgi:hypothetical protein